MEEDTKNELKTANVDTPEHKIRNFELRETGGDYDPHLHRDVPNATSNFQTLVHLLKGTLGTGILAMPEAFKNSGYVNGLVSTVIITFISTYCFLMLAINHYILYKRHHLPVLSYPKSMKMSLQEGPTFLRGLSKIAIPVVDGFLIAYQSGICCIYVAGNIKDLINSALDIKSDVKIYVAMLLIPFMLLLCVRNLKLLPLFSNVVTFVGIILISYYFFKDGVSAPPDFKPFNSLDRYPLFFGTVLFSINGIGVVTAVENNMKTPKSFNMVMSAAMAIICVLYALFGLTGYLKFGGKLKEGSVLAKFIRGMFALATFISFGLQGYVPVSIVWGTYLSKRYETSKHKIYYEFAVRISLVLITSAVAATIPFIGLAISLIGALCIPVLGLICPALMEICVLYQNKLSHWNLGKNILFIVIGVVSLIVGTYTSILGIIYEYKE